jgi:hypothetical protein
MITYDEVIESVQNTQKTFVNTFVYSADLKSALNDLIDSQSKVSKELFLITQDFLKVKK